MTIRQPCPPGACDCDREQLLQTPGADARILTLTRQEEKKLIARLMRLPVTNRRKVGMTSSPHGPYG